MTRIKSGIVIFKGSVSDLIKLFTIWFKEFQRNNAREAGVHIIPKIADFSRSPTNFLHLSLKKMPPIVKKMPPIKKTFSNSTNTFAPICPQLKKMPPIKIKF